ncbi:DgyrCDS2828 [Dimorphilus gyrociliatus]|uniref:ETFB lysine methyltransferase n=1 Tax=Dimorphilus gyrociliatus TaxID=2664684 RepID=A0A7I8VEG8_9ANNE|nr:DgyrCDS2828 [Dimorphilus gyrociliatus]
MINFNFRFILDNSDLIKNKNVLDIGSGCGASSIASIMSKASFVTANDINREAMVILDMNCKLNFIDSDAIKKVTSNLINAHTEYFPYDIVLIGDMFYDESIAKELIGWMDKLSKEGKEIYLGDPQRNDILSSLDGRLSIKATYNLPENVRKENNGLMTTKVWKFE